MGASMLLDICFLSYNDESPKLKHDSPGLLSMAIADRDTRGSLFTITLNEAHHLDRKFVVFGKLVYGHEVLKKIENAGSDTGKPDVTVKIVNSGEFHGSRRKGKHKKSSKERRKKRRRYETSESDSSTDSDTESSDSDSDSDSYISSSTDTSSSSDVKRRKRKRSKREKHRREKRREKHREKMRKKREKKLKRKLKSSSDSLSGGESKSNSEGDAGAGGLDGEFKNTGMKPDGSQSHSVEDGQAASGHQKKGETAAPFERKGEEFPKENGGHKSNVITHDRPDKSPERNSDAVDNSPSKSRFLLPFLHLSYFIGSSYLLRDGNPSESPRRSTSRSPSIRTSSRHLSDRSTSPAKRGNRSLTRSVSRSPPAKRGSFVSKSPSPIITNLRRGRNRSPTPRRLSRSPPRTSSKKSLKSRSRSPVRYTSPSMSPIKTSRRSLSRSPARVPSRRGSSRSPVRGPHRKNLRSYSRSPPSAGRRERSPRSGRGRSSSRSPSVDGSSKRIRRGRGFSEQYSYVRRYRSRSPVRSSYRYGRNDRDRYTSYRRSPRRYRSPRGRTPPRYRNGRSRSRSVSRSPIRYRGRRHSRSPVRSRSPQGRYRPSPRAERQRTRSPSGGSRSAASSRSPTPPPRQRSKERSASLSGSPPAKGGGGGLVSYDGDGSPDSSRD
ncbi:unnamed protein product [Cuscuta campestris]|uniref:PPIase cyclophilin-type domain-containing protein n=1 Tax=Cuscuta campestris TaxID=132261 RepID=A0A484N8H2_9ASTE|nr:unnamed protein product [Cuscuta campestris]